MVIAMRSFNKWKEKVQEVAVTYNVKAMTEFHSPNILQSSLIRLHQQKWDGATLKIGIPFWKNHWTIRDTKKSTADATKERNEWRYTMHNGYIFLDDIMHWPMTGGSLYKPGIISYCVIHQWSLQCLRMWVQLTQCYKYSSTAFHASDQSEGLLLGRISVARGKGKSPPTTINGQEPLIERHWGPEENWVRVWWAGRSLFAKVTPSCREGLHWDYDESMRTRAVREEELAQLRSSPLANDLAFMLQSLRLVMRLYMKAMGASKS